MIIKVALVLLYLVIGLWLFVTAVQAMGGKREVYDSTGMFIFSLVLVTILWPYFLFAGLIRRRK